VCGEAGKRARANSNVFSPSDPGPHDVLNRIEAAATMNADLRATRGAGLTMRGGAG
jgi:hypothetical protein